MYRAEWTLPISSSELTKTTGASGRLVAELVERSQREHELDEPALHVVGAGAVEPAVLPVSHAARGSERPDGVHVPDDQLVRAGLVRTRGRAKR